MSYINNNSIISNNWSLGVSSSNPFHGVETIIKEFEPKHIAINEDPVVLACTIKRLRKIATENPKDHTLNTIRIPLHLLSISEDENIISPLITDDDRQLAKTIRDHYSKKLTWIILQEESISEYRSKLKKLLLVTDNLYTDKQCGIAYKLPYFYEYDMALVDIFGGEANSLIGEFSTESQQKQLTFITKLNASQRKKKTYEYWFSDDTGNRVVIELDTFNPLLPLWEAHIQSTPITVTAKFNPVYKDKFKYYSAASWKWQLN